MKKITSRNALVIETNTSTNSTLIIPDIKRDKCYSIPEVAELMRVCPRTLRRWREKNELPAAKIGGTVLYPADLLHDILMRAVQNSVDSNKKAH